MTKYKTTRKSVCSACGKRLSEKTDSGDIRWHPAHVDDTGIFCATCRSTEKNNKNKKLPKI